MKLSEYLKQTNQTHKSFANKLGVTQPQITRIVNGKRNPSTLLVRMIEQETSGRVTLEDLVNPEIPSRLQKNQKTRKE